ncbi:MAG: MBL fold metallo-hydrolase [Bacillota bacterium]|nr:MBL fold metallo-hydrolase [Bacillota bacterium]
MKIQLVRHATHVITYNGKKLLLDPMFSEKGSLLPVLNAPNEHLNNPLTELPMEIKEFINVDAIVVTHTHRDHFDDAAIECLPKSLPLFCQPEDEKIIQEKGFTKVIPIEKDYDWEGITFIRTKGEHGRGELAEKMGPVSGFVFHSEFEPTLYIIGDSVWYSEIEEVFTQYSPDFAIVFAGEAQFLQGDPITMGLNDIHEIVTRFPKTNLIISHMESWNHCVLTRNEVRNFIKENRLEKRIWVPENGEMAGASTVSK